MTHPPMTHCKSKRLRIALTATFAVPLCLALGLVWIMTPRGSAEPAYQFVGTETTLSDCDNGATAGKATLVSLRRC